MVLFDLHSPQPTDDKVSRQLKTKERRDSMDTTLYTSTTEDEAQEQRELEEAIVDTYIDRADYLDKHPPNMKEYGKTMKTFSALLLTIFISCSMIPQKKQPLYNYYDVEGNRHIFKEDLYKIRETEHFYCYEHEKLHELVVYNVPNNEALMKVLAEEEAQLPEGEE